LSALVIWKPSPRDCSREDGNFQAQVRRFEAQMADESLIEKSLARARRKLILELIQRSRQRDKKLCGSIP
jgi:hypothetical protein